MHTGGSKTWGLILVVVILALNLSRLAGMSAGRDFPARNLAETVYDQEYQSPPPFDNDTIRVDPLDGLKKYRDGYDITNKHYWSSTAFTAIYGVAIALAWLLSGIGYGGFLLVRKTCCRRTRKPKNRSPCSRQCNRKPLLLATLLTILALTATGLVLGVNTRFHSRAKTVIDIIIDTADDASDTIYVATGAMKNMSTNFGGANGNGEVTNFLNSMSRRLDSQAADIEREARKNRRNIDKGLKILYIVSTLLFSLNLVAVIALLVFGALKFRRTLYILIVICWILTALYWAFFGGYFFLGNFVDDTCTAFEHFQVDPYNNSLSSILPCDDLVSASSFLNDVSEQVYDVVNRVNDNISISYGNGFQLCNPFSGPPNYVYQPGSCPANSIKLGDIPQVLRMLACPGSEGDPCNGGILVPTDQFDEIIAYSTSIQELLNVYPGLEYLIDCQMVHDAFAEILDYHCKPLKRYGRLTWASLIVLSVIMMALVIISTIKARHEQENHSLESSVKPQSTKGDMVEYFETTKESKDDQILV